jgi:hypothetical protein
MEAILNWYGSDTKQLWTAGHEAWMVRKEMHVEFYWGRPLRNVHIQERERDGRITFTWYFGTYDVAGAGLYNVLFFCIWCSTFEFCRHSDMILINTVTCLWAVRQSHSGKSCTSSLYRGFISLFSSPVLSAAKSVLQAVANRTTLPNKVTTCCTVSTVVSNAGTTTGCSSCHIYTLVSWKPLQHALIFWFSRELAAISCMLSNAQYYTKQKIC